MTTPHALKPALTGNTMQVDVALNQVQYIESKIAELTDGDLLIDKFFSPFGQQITAGGLLYHVVTRADFFTARDVEPRTPGAEYPVVEGVQPEPRLALVEDYGGKIEVLDETRARNDIRKFSNQVLQLTNTLKLKLDNAALKAINDCADIEVYSPSNNWENLVFVGPLDEITPSSQRPTAHFAEAQLLATLEEMGVKHDLIVMNPTQEMQLRVAYAEGLQAMLTGAGLSIYSNPRIPEGVLYALERGRVGAVGFEVPLTVEPIPDRAHRQTIVQAYAVPAFAVDRPNAIKKIVLPA